MTKPATKYRMAGIGEILWDLLPDGKQLGGSPMNVVYHCQAAGIKSVVVSAVGSDPLGNEIIEQVRQIGNSIEYIQRCTDRPSGTVSVLLNQGIPDFTIHNDVAWDKLQWNKPLETLAKNIDAVAFGSLAQRDPVSRNTINNFLNQMRPDSIRVYDINIRQHYHSKEQISTSLNFATILKINDDELPILAKYLDLKGSINDQIRNIMNKFDLNIVAYTKGELGSVLFSKESISEMPATKVKIQDTVGAGDTFTAVLITGLLQGKPLEEIHQEATDMASWVCSQQGGTPPY